MTEQAGLKNGPILWLSRPTIAAAYLGLLLMFGGGGTPAPLSELVCQLIAALALAGWVVAAPAKDMSRPVQVAQIAALLLIPAALQLVPLPPRIWHALPGQASVQAALALVGRVDNWKPLSIAPHRSLAGLLALLPPLIALAMTAMLPPRHRGVLIGTIAFGGLLSALVGAGQLAGSGTGPLQFYNEGEAGILFGFQANRNAAADVLMIGLLAVAAVWGGLSKLPRSAPLAFAFAALAALLVLATILTASRTGIALLPIALCFAVLLGRPNLATQWRLPRLWQGGLGLAGLGVLALVLWRNQAISRVLARFDFVGEYRPDLWHDTLFAIRQYWPLGSGLGTFVPAIYPAERLEAIGAALPNRAHNEVLELALEGGLPLLLAWAVAGILVGRALWRALRGTSGVPREHAWFAAGTLLLTGLHSMVDYPFRSMALATLIGVAAGLVMVSSNGTAKPGPARADEVK